MKDLSINDDNDKMDMALLSIPRLIAGYLKETCDPPIYQYTKHVISEGSNSLRDSIHLRIRSIRPGRFVTLTKNYTCYCSLFT